MAITSFDGFIASAKQYLSVAKTAARASVAASWFSVFDLAGNPGAGVLAGTSTAAGVVPTDATAGCPTIDAFGGGATGHLAQVDFGSSVACRLKLFDLVFKAGAYAFNAAQALSGQPVMAQPLINARVSIIEEKTVVKVEAFDPNDLLIQRDWTSPELAECPYVSRKMLVTLSDLEQMGFDVTADDLRGSDEASLSNARFRRKRDDRDETKPLDKDQSEHAKFWFRTKHYARSVPSGKAHYFACNGVFFAFAIPPNRNISRYLIGEDNAVWELSRMWASDGHKPNALTMGLSVAVAGVRFA